MPVETNDFDWFVRSYIYATILERGVPPTYSEVAAEREVSPEQARDAYERLDARHAIFLTPGTHEVRMAHPFSGIATPFRVHVNGRTYWANCAWDALGIPAALHADACVDAETGDGAPVRLDAADGQVRGWDGVVHFALPFRRWYDDFILT